MEHSHEAANIRARLTGVKKQSNLKDFVYGSIDGTITTFAIVAGVEGAGFSSSVIVALGIANVLADGFSMAASNYSGSKAEKDDAERLMKVEHRHIDGNPDGEREEVRQILALKGLSGDVLEQAVHAITLDRDTWVNLMMVEEYGVLPNHHNPARAAISTFVAFVLCGFVPLLPYLFALSDPFPIATLVTGLTFFSIGTLKSRWSLQSWWASGFETLIIGSIAAAVAYFVGGLFA